MYNADVKEGSTGNVFNTTKTAGTNIVGGPYIGGNFWAKPDGTGFSQTATDADGDGISDTVYSFSGNLNTDFLPLVEGSKSNQSVPPVNLNTSEMGTSTNETRINNTEIGTTSTTEAETNNTEIAATGTEPVDDEAETIATDTEIFNETE